jgi:hypothetical protein
MNISKKHLILLGIILISSINSGMITLETKSYTRTYGGNGGGYFNDGKSSKIKRIRIRHGLYIDQIQTRGKSGGWNSAHGGNGGRRSYWTVPRGDCINRIAVRSGKYVDSLRFFTKKGRSSPKYGGNGGNYSLVNLGNNCLREIYGRSGAYVDQIGFYY